MLQKCPRRDQLVLKEITRKLNEARPLIERLRNSLGGHVETHFVADALNDMKSDRFGFFEVGAKIKLTHYRFAGELVAEMLVTGIPPDQREAQIEKDMKTLAGLLSILDGLERIIAIYLEARNLV